MIETRLPVAHEQDLDDPQLLEITIFAAPVLNVLNRILLQLNRRQVDVRQIMADFVEPDASEFKGSEEMLLRVSLIAYIPNDAELEQIRKLFDRIVDVYKVHQAVPA